MFFLTEFMFVKNIDVTIVAVSREKNELYIGRSDYIKIFDSSNALLSIIITILATRITLSLDRVLKYRVDGCFYSRVAASVRLGRKLYACQHVIVF